MIDDSVDFVVCLEWSILNEKDKTLWQRSIKDP